MLYNSARGIKVGKWDVDEEILSSDLNASVGALIYQNLADIVGSLIEGVVGDGETGTKNVLVNGLKVSLTNSNADLAITAGLAISYQGSYFSQSDDSFGFQSAQSGAPFLAMVPQAVTIAGFASTATRGASQEVRGNVEIFPLNITYNEQGRDFVESGGTVTSRNIDIRREYSARGTGSPVVTWGAPAAASAVAPTVAPGRIKIAEVLLSTSGAASIVTTWTSGADDFLEYNGQFNTFGEGDIANATVTRRGLVELATRSELLAGAPEDRVATIDDIKHMIESVRDEIVPIGCVRWWPGSTPPAKNRECNGAALSRTDFATLFAAIGTHWGVGDGSTTFLIPNLQGRFPMGRESSGVLSTIGRMDGEAEVTLSVSQMPQHTHAGRSHSHGLNSHTHTTPDHTHTLFDQLRGSRIARLTGGTSPVTIMSSNIISVSGTTNSGGGSRTGPATGSTTGATAGVNNAGGGGAHNNLPPYAVGMWIIRVE